MSYKWDKKELPPANYPDTPQTPEDNKYFLLPEDWNTMNEQIEILYTPDGGTDLYNKATKQIDSNYLPSDFGQEKIELAEEKTYEELKKMVDEGNLIVGKLYIINDFQTTAPTDADVNGEIEPLVLIAINKNQFAIRVFSQKYPNDIIEFDFTQGDKGEMILRHDLIKNNRTPYDFRTIMWRRYKATGPVLASTLAGTKGKFYIINNIVYKCIIAGTFNTNNFVKICDATEYRFFKNYPGIVLSTDYINRYTFDDNTDFISKEAIPGNGQRNNILNTDKESINNIFLKNCHNNTFGLNCHNNIFGLNCNNSILGNAFRGNMLSTDCYDNVFGVNCFNNIVGVFCMVNTFEARCHNSIFGNGCHYNTFRAYCNDITFPINCKSNTLGTGCKSITFMSEVNSIDVKNVAGINYRINYSTSGVTVSQIP